MPSTAYQQQLNRAKGLIALADAGLSLTREAHDLQLPEPNSDRQRMFVESKADITIGGGAGGGGKSWGLTRIAAEGVHDPHYTCLMLRRQKEQLELPGGLWQETMGMYKDLGGVARDQRKDWKFSSGAYIKLAGMDRLVDRYKYQGAQTTRQCWDELTHFAQEQFEYVALSRARSKSKLPPQVFAGTNPMPPEDPVGGWVARLIQWWWDQETGYAIPERAGVVRWFYRGDDDEFVWFDTEREARQAFPSIDAPPKSLTFIPFDFHDNPAQTDQYLGSLMALNVIDRERMGKGNWRITGKGGGLLRREWFRLVEDPLIASGGRHDGVLDLTVRAWDLAGTEGGTGSATVGVLLSRYASEDSRKRYVVRDMKYGRLEPADVLRLIIDTIVEDGPGVVQRLPIDPAQAGKFQKHAYESEIRQELKARGVHLPETHLVFERVAKAGSTRGSSKWDRAKPFAAIAAPVHDNIYGSVDVVSRAWTSQYLDELHRFDNTGVTRDDIVDATADAYDQINQIGQEQQQKSAVFRPGHGRRSR